MRLIDADKIVEVAEHAYGEWNKAMAAAEKRQINRCFKMQELCKAVKGVADDCPTIDPESLRPTAHWISVKDRLPDVFDEVLVYDTFSNTSISIAWRETTPRKNGIVNWYWNSQMSYPEDLTHVTHWMSLPNPPEVTP